MIDVYYQLAGLLLTIMIAILFVSKTKLMFDTDRAFLWLLMNGVLSIALDILAVYAMKFWENSMLGHTMTAILCKLFLCVQMGIGYFSVRYTLAIIRADRQRQKRLLRCCGILHILFAVVVLCAPITFMSGEDSEAVHFSGMGVIIAYSLWMVCLFYCAVWIWKRRLQIQKSYLISSVTFLGIILGSLLLAHLRPEQNIISFALALALLFIYLEMENPNDYVDSASGALNDYAFQRWEAGLFDGQDSVMLFLLVISEAEYLKKKMGLTMYDQMMSCFAQQMSHMHGAKLFRLDSGEFVLAEKDRNQREYVRQELARIRQDVSEQFPELKAEFVKFGLIPSTQAYEELMLLNADMRFFLKHMHSLPGDVLHVLDEEILKVKKEEEYVVMSLKKAIEQDEIMVYYQPIYSTAKQRYTTAEALIRIRDLEGRFMSPEMFIPIAEQRGFILTLGHAVFENVCRFIKEQDLEKRGFDYLEINLSTVQCMQKGLATELVSIMKEYGISPGFINLEITETAAIQSEKTLMVNMQRLIQLGVSFSLDDYGSGYSNLDYVIRMPFYLVKLDKMLVWSSFESAKSRVLLESSVDMFKKMNLRIVAEGVETKAQALYLDQLGVDYLQGYFFSKPISEEAFAEVISHNLRRNLYREA